MRKALRVAAGLLVGILTAWLPATIITLIARRVLFPGLSGEFELAASGADRALLILIYAVFWLGGIIACVWGALNFEKVKADVRGALNRGKE